MVKCEFCNSVYYGNETKCTSCGAVLPAQEIKENIDNNRGNININNAKQVNINMKATNTSKSANTVGIVVFCIVFVGIFFTVISIISSSIMFSDFPYEGSVSYFEREEAINESEYVETYLYSDEDLLSFEKYKTMYEENSSDEEAVLYLTWYYIYTEEPSISYEIVNSFLEEAVKDDGEFYIQLAGIYMNFELYGYAYYILDKGYEYTKLESISQYMSDIPIGSVIYDTSMMELLQMMFGKDINLVTYKDLASIKSIEIDNRGTKILYSTVDPVVVGGHIENYQEYKKDMKEINLAQSIYDSTNFDLFVNLRIFLDGSGRAVLLSHLPYLNNLEYFEIVAVDGFEKIPPMKNLKGLCLNGSGVKAIGDIEKLESLEYFELYRTEVYDVTNVNTLKNIKFISFNDNENIINIDSIGSLPTLQKLEIIDMEISALNINTDVVMLQSLVLEDTTIRNLDFLQNCHGLLELKLVNNDEIITMPSFSNMTKLERLTVQSIQDEDYYSNVNFIKGLISLKYLEIVGNLHNFDVVGGLTNLEELIISSSVIGNNTSPIGNLTNLKSLTIAGGPVDSVMETDFLSNLKNLNYLCLLGQRSSYVKGNEIFDLENLESLYIDRYIGDFSRISKLKKLKELSVGGVSISEKIYVQSDGFMTSISTDGEKTLGDFSSSLSQLTNMEVLNIASNKLDNIEFIRSMTNLNKLNINDNYITDLEPLAQLSNLEYIEVAENPISNWAGLREKENLVIVEKFED